MYICVHKYTTDLCASHGACLHAAAAAGPLASLLPCLFWGLVGHTYVGAGDQPHRLPLGDRLHAGHADEASLRHLPPDHPLLQRRLRQVCMYVGVAAAAAAIGMFYICCYLLLLFCVNFGLISSAAAIEMFYLFFLTNDFCFLCISIVLRQFRVWFRLFSPEV